MISLKKWANNYFYTCNSLQCRHKKTLKPASNQKRRKTSKAVKKKLRMIKYFSPHMTNTKNARVPSGKRDTVRCRYSIAPPPPPRTQWHRGCRAAALTGKPGGREIWPSFGPGGPEHMPTWAPEEQGASSVGNTWLYSHEMYAHPDNYISWWLG